MDNSSVSVGSTKNNGYVSSNLKSAEGSDALNDAKKLLSEIAENSSDPKMKETLQKAIGNIDKKLGVEDEVQTQTQTKSADKTDENSSLEKTKEMLQELSKNSSGNVQDSLNKAIKNIDNYLGDDKERAEDDTKLNENVSNAFDDIKDSMNTLADKYVQNNPGMKDSINSTIKEMEDYLKSSDDSDTEKLDKMQDMLSDSFSNNKDRINNFSSFMEDYGETSSKINNIVTDAKQSIAKESSGLNISQEAQTLAAQSREETFSQDSLAKLPFEQQIGQNPNNLNKDLIKQLLEGRNMLDLFT